MTPARTSKPVPNPHLTSRDLDRALLGDPAGPAGAAIDRHLGECAACAAELSGRRTDAATFAAAVLPRTLEAATRPAPARFWRWAARGLLIATPAVTAAVWLLVARPADGPPAEPAAPALLGVKGVPALKVYVRHGDRVRGAADGDLVAPGDALRFAVDAPGRPYLMFAGVDGAGRATVYHPYHGGASAAVDPAARFELPISVVIDDSPGPERIFLFLSDAPLAAPAVMGALESLGRAGADAIRATREVSVPGAAVQTSFVLEKRP